MTTYRQSKTTLNYYRCQHNCKIIWEEYKSRVLQVIFCDCRRRWQHWGYLKQRWLVRRWQHWRYLKQRWLVRRWQHWGYLKQRWLVRRWQHWGYLKQRWLVRRWQHWGYLKQRWLDTLWSRGNAMQFTEIWYRNKYF